MLEPNQVQSVHPTAAQGVFPFFSLFWFDSFFHILCLHVNNHTGCRGINKNQALECNCLLGKRPKQKAMKYEYSVAGTARFAGAVK